MIQPHPLPRRSRLRTRSRWFRLGGLRAACGGVAYRVARKVEVYQFCNGVTRGTVPGSRMCARVCARACAHPASHCHIVTLSSKCMKVKGDRRYARRYARAESVTALKNNKILPVYRGEPARLPGRAVRSRSPMEGRADHRASARWRLGPVDGFLTVKTHDFNDLACGTGRELHGAALHSQRQSEQYQALSSARAVDRRSAGPAARAAWQGGWPRSAAEGRPPGGYPRNPRRAPPHGSASVLWLNCRIFDPELAAQKTVPTPARDRGRDRGMGRALARRRKVAERG